MVQPYKTCPNCQQPAVLSMPRCGRCGMPFPTAPLRPRRRSIWIACRWLLASLAMAVAVAVWRGAPHSGPLVGVWLSRDVISDFFPGEPAGAERLVLRSDGSFSDTLLSSDPGSPRAAGRWWAEGAADYVPGVANGFLYMSEAEFDAEKCAWQLSRDRNTLRIVDSRGNSDEYQREGTERHVDEVPAQPAGPGGGLPDTRP